MKQKQSPKDMRNALTRLVGPRSLIQYGNKDREAVIIELKYSRIFGAMEFLKLYGDRAAIYHSMLEERRSLQATLRKIGQIEDRKKASLLARCTVRQLHNRAINAKLCEEKLKSIGLIYDHESRQIREYTKANRPRDLYRLLVEDLFETVGLKFRPANSPAMRQAIVEALPPIFDAACFDTRAKGKLGRTLDNYIARKQKRAR